ncbi:energy transducer TonB [Entomobacter blattae]|uniref:Protein TonB n=1 Tax=Entomobacter blattae TaxID=2762277 RepID=A0A7H1NR93_9PROT|nr:energy transducer TonB [Entomobacter blattae]QNT78303.1 hypothetical protein JGUZn3_10750 [Entomobacter blattae]
MAATYVMKNNKLRMVWLIVTIIIHILFIHALIRVMAKPDTITPVIPLSVTIEASASSANSAAPPAAPPPSMIEPPPPVVMPPKLNMPVPEPPKTPPIKKLTPRKTPPTTHPAPSPAPSSQSQASSPSSTTATAAAPSHAASTQHDRNAGVNPIGGGRPNYPETMQELGKEGSVDAACDIEANGTTSNCHLVNVSGGQAFGEAVLTFLKTHRYQPAIRNGVPVRTPNHTLHFTFQLN